MSIMEEIRIPKGMVKATITSDGNIRFTDEFDIIGYYAKEPTFAKTIDGKITKMRHIGSFSIDFLEQLFRMAKEYYDEIEDDFILNIYYEENSKSLGPAKIKNFAIAPRHNHKRKGE